MSNNRKQGPQDDYYVCPVCKQQLIPTAKGFFCPRDGVGYPVNNGIPDFVVEDQTKSTNPFLRAFDSAAQTYEAPSSHEGPSWYGVMDQINAELGLPSIEEMIGMLTKMVDAKNGLGLDVACGTGFVTRSIAQHMRLVYGIDLSMGMLEQATRYAREKGVGNVRFARSRAERLPFPDAVFDGVTCSLALQLFPDIVEALSEMARVMGSGARLAVLAPVKGDPSVYKMFLERMEEPTIKRLFESGTSIPLLLKMIRNSDVERLEKSLSQTGMHLFDVEELDTRLSQTGFKGFAYNIYGPFILFHVEKGGKCLIKWLRCRGENGFVFLPGSGVNSIQNCWCYS